MRGQGISCGSCAHTKCETPASSTGQCAINCEACNEDFSVTSRHEVLLEEKGWKDCLLQAEAVCKHLSSFASNWWSSLPTTTV
eukprot:300037-Amphidinium_carterae.3